MVLKIIVEVLNASGIDAIPLLQRKRMIRRLQLNVWTDSIVADMHPCLQVHGLRISGDRYAEPAKVRAVARPLLYSQQVLELVEIFLTERYPNSRGKDVVRPHDRKL